ncbi:MAG: zinc-binding alcohol dehydrogenase [Planctomycetes bacterium]|nr:zinc-binding alcohol dehydrogenase [Planctomycetota bacterium]
MKGLRVLWPQRGQVILDEEDVPTPGPDEVLIRTEVSLISPGTERAFLLSLPNTSEKFPTTCGYNNVGQVIEVGRGVEGLRAGDRVVTGTNHAQFVRARASDAIRVPDELPSREAVFFHMVSIALQGVRKARIEIGDSALVIGQGLIGNLALQLARFNGAFPTVAMDTEPARLDLARRCGADETVDPTDPSFEKKVKACIPAGAPSVVIEATGHPKPVLTAFQLAAWHGRVVLLASTRGETTGVNFYQDVHRKGLTILGAHNSIRPSRDNSPGFWTWHEDVRVALRLTAAGRLNIAPLISHELDAREAPKAYQLLIQWHPGLMGALLHWEGL